MSNYTKIIKAALESAGTGAKKVGKGAVGIVKKDPKKALIGAGVLGTGVLGAGEGTQYLLSKLGDYPDDPAYNMYKEGKSIDEIKSTIEDLDPEILYELLNTENDLRTYAKNGGEDLKSILKTSKYIDDKAIYRILNELKGEQ